MQFTTVLSLLAVGAAAQSFPETGVCVCPHDETLEQY